MSKHSQVSRVLFVFASLTLFPSIGVGQSQDPGSITPEQPELPSLNPPLTGPQEVVPPMNPFEQAPGPLIEAQESQGLEQGLELDIDPLLESQGVDQKDPRLNSVLDLPAPKPGQSAPAVTEQGATDLGASEIDPQVLFNQKILEHPFLEMKMQPGDELEILGLFSSIVRTAPDKSKVRYVFEAVSGAHVATWHNDDHATVVNEGRGLLLIDSAGKGMLLRNRMEVPDTYIEARHLYKSEDMVELKKIAKNSVDTIFSNFPVDNPNETIEGLGKDYGRLLVLETKDRRTGKVTAVFVDMSAGLEFNKDTKPVWLGFVDLSHGEYQNSFFILKDSVLNQQSGTTHEMALFNRWGGVVLQRQGVKSWQVSRRHPDIVFATDFIEIIYLDGRVEKIDMITDLLRLIGESEKKVKFPPSNSVPLGSGSGR